MTGAKLSILDVRCQDRADTQFVVEMQLVHMASFLERAFYSGYESDAEQFETGDMHAGLTDVVVISICDFELWSDAAQEHQKLPRIPMLSR